MTRVLARWTVGESLAVNARGVAENGGQRVSAFNALGYGRDGEKGG